MAEIIDFAAEKQRREEDRMWQEFAERIQDKCYLVIYEWSMDALCGYSDSIDD